MDWEFTPENQKKFDEVTANIHRLQAQMGIAPMTLEQRATAYNKKKEEQAQFEAQFGNIRPPPKWKV